MRRVFKKTIVVVLSILLLLSLLPMTALAEDGPIYPAIEVGDTIRIEPTDSGISCLQFIPSESGWYEIDSSEEQSWYLYAQLYKLNDGDYSFIRSWNSHEDGHLHIAYRLEEGSTYRFDFECDGMTGPYNVTLYRPETYTIRFHSGDGTFFDWSTGATIGTTYEDEFPANAYINTYLTPMPGENGMMFTGWALNSDATLPEFEAYDYKVTGDVDLYAVFGRTLTVQYYCNGGYFSWDDQLEMNEAYIGAGDWFSNYAIEYPDDSKLFVGWFTEDGVQYTSQDRVMDDLTVYAHWADPITVTYDANGGTFPDNGGGTTFTHQYTPGDYFSYYHVEHSEPNMHLIGWFTQREGGEEVGRGDYRVTEDMTVYAHWRKMYMVTLNANGGYFAFTEDQMEEVTFGFENEYVNSLPTPTIDDSSFVLDGWYDQKTGGQKFNYSDPLPVGQTLYAHWVPGKQIIYDANGGSFVHNGASTYTVAYLPGSYLSEEYNIRRYNMTNPDPRKIFRGWATSKTATEPDITFNQQKVDDYTTLYAVWVDGIKITEQAGDGYFYGTYNYETGENEKLNSIEFYVPSGTMVGSLSSYYSGLSGTNYYIQAYTDQPKKADFNYRSLTAGGPVVDNDYVLTEDTTLYVVWKDTVIITFDPGNGYFTYLDPDEVNPDGTATSAREVGRELSINYGNNFNVTSNNPTLAFIGWSTTGREEDIISRIYADSDKTLYAVYKSGQIITLDSNISAPYWGRLGNQSVGTYYGTQTVVWPDGTPLSQIGVNGNIYGGGYYLIGLSTTKDGTDLVNDNWYPTENTTLYLIFAEGTEAYFEAYPGTFPSTGEEWIEVQVSKGNAIGEIETPVLTGKVFAGWANYATDEIVDPKTYIPGTDEYPEFYAVWEDGDQQYEWITKGVDKNYTGLAQEKSGTWYYVKNGEPDLSYTGVKNNEYGWWRVENGIVNFKYNGLAANEYGTWYLKDGKVDFNYTGFAAGVASGTSGWWYVEKGQIKFNKTDIISGTANTAANKAGVSGWWYVINSKVFTGDTVAKNSNGWWAIRGGKVDFNYTGFIANANGWWYAEKGQVTFKKNGLIQGKANNDAEKPGEDGWWLVKGSLVTNETTVASNDYGWWKVDQGKVDFEFEGFANNAYGWWYLQGGKVNFNYTGFAEGTADGKTGWWYVEKGQLTFKKNGLTNGEGRDGWWLVKNSKVTDETTVASNDYGWWRVENGKVNFAFEGIASNQYGTWYLREGKVDFNYTGFTPDENGWWYVEKGQITYKKNDVIHGMANDYVTKAPIDGWWYVRGSKVTLEPYTTVAQNAYGWWYICFGQVDFTYNGVGHNDYGDWYIENGQVNFKFTGPAYGRTFKDGKAVD